jgi:hypothetical protein
MANVDDQATSVAAPLTEILSRLILREELPPLVRFD